MSFNVVGWVLDHSEAKLGARLVLIVLAEHAHVDGTKSFPTVESIARRARLSERGARDALRRLEADGAIVKTGQTGYGAHIYTVIGPFNKRGAKSAARQETAEGGQITTDLLSQTAPEPSLEPSEEPSGPYVRRRVQETWLGEENLIQHRDTYFADRGLQARVMKAVEKYGLDDVLAAIKAYAAVLRSDTHYWSHSWPLADFLKRGIDRFVPEAKPLETMRLSGKAGKKKPRERIYTRA
jgi:hypothetical protein